jgi:CheY-like chemotaxis protein
MADAWNISHDLHGKPGFHLAVFNRLSLSPDAKNALDVVRKWLIPEFRDNIIVLTSDKTIHALRMLESLGVRRYLHKPVLQSEIQQLLSKVFQQEHSESQVKTAATAQQENTLRLEVLLAEDQLINQKIVVQLLTRKGWTVTTALNGLEAVSQAEKKRFDLILMDVQMPGMDGFEATREIRRNASSLNAASPIIALTANAMKGDRERCIEAGMNDYVTKPLLPEEFFRTIQKYI